MVGIIEFGDFAFFVDEQRHAFQAVFGDKLAMRFGRISRQAKDLNFSGFVFFDVLLKLNKLANSDAGVIFGIKGENNGLIIFKRIAERPEFAVLVGQCKIRRGLGGRGRCVFYIRSGAAAQSQKHKRNKNEFCLSHKILLMPKGFTAGGSMIGRPPVVFKGI